MAETKATNLALIMLVFSPLSLILYQGGFLPYLLESFLICQSCLWNDIVEMFNVFDVTGK